MAKPFIQSGGGLNIGEGYWGSWHATTPFVGITLDDTQLELKVSFFTTLRHYVFPFASVRRLSIYRKWFSRSLLIEHSLPDCPPYVFLWSPDLASLIAALEQRGLHVEASPEPSTRIA